MTGRKPPKQPKPATQRKPAKSLQTQKTPAEAGASRRRCNQLDGKRWLQNSISIWSDVRKSAEENRLKHPAMFPQMLVERLIETFLPPDGTTVLDPFAGTGSTVVAAARMGKRGVGLELSTDYVEQARTRIAQLEYPANAEIVHASALDLAARVAAESVDLCITSPPYWNILTRKRTADSKAVRNYGDNAGDLGTVEDYAEFLAALQGVFRQVYAALKPGAFCCAIVMDLRKKKHFFPFHSDLATRLVEVGFVWDDLIVWNRQSDYNNLRPLGYPSVFRVNKVHEFILLMQKPILDPPVATGG